MTNRLMTAEEVTKEIVKPMVDAYHAGLPELYAEARKAFAAGKMVYRTHYFGLAIELRPQDLPQ